MGTLRTPCLLAGAMKELKTMPKTMLQGLISGHAELHRGDGDLLPLSQV